MQGEAAHNAEPPPQPQPPPPRPLHSSTMMLQSPSSSAVAASPSSSSPPSLLVAGGGGHLFSLGLTPPISPAAAGGSAHATPLSLFLSHSSTPTSAAPPPAPSPPHTLHMFLSAPSSAVPSRAQSPAPPMHEHDAGGGSGSMTSGGLLRDSAMTDSLGSSRDVSAVGARFSFSFNSAGGLMQNPHAMMLSHAATHSRPHSPMNTQHAFASPPHTAHAQMAAMHAQSQSLFALNSDGSGALSGSPELRGLLASLLREGQTTGSASSPCLSAGMLHQLAASASVPPSSPYASRAGVSRDSSGDSWSHNSMDLTANAKSVFEVFDPAPHMHPWHARWNANGQATFSDRDSSSSTLGSASAVSGMSAASTASHSPGSVTPSHLPLHGPPSHPPASLSSLLAQANHTKLDASSAIMHMKLESLSLSQGMAQRMQPMQHESLMHSPHQRSQHTSPAHAQGWFTPDLSSMDVSSLARATRSSHASGVAASAASSPAAASLPSSSRGRGALLSAVDLADPHGLAASGSSGSSVLSSPSTAAAASKQTPFVCDVCQKQFTQKGGLQNHARIHKGERPFKCEWDGCDKAFAQKCNLTRHQRCHTGEKPYKCCLCPKAYNRRWGLLVHSRLHGRDVPVMHKQRCWPKGAAAGASNATPVAEAAAGGAVDSRAARSKSSKVPLTDSDSDYTDSPAPPTPLRSSAPLSSSAPLLPLASRSTRSVQTQDQATSARVAGLPQHSAHSSQRDAQHRSPFATCDSNSAAAAPAAVSASPPLLSYPSSGGLLEFASSHPPSLLGRHPATRPLRNNTQQERQRPITTQRTALRSAEQAQLR